jgi:hypothetical protein
MSNDINGNVEINNILHGTWFNYFQVEESHNIQPCLYQNTNAITLNELTTVLTMLWNNKTPEKDST